MDDPIQRHPTRAEQLDILAAIVADQTQAGDRVLDLGMGTGYVAHLILNKQPEIRITGVDLKAESLEAAKNNLAGLGSGHDFVVGNLMESDGIDLPHADYKIALSVLTFHDLSDDAKQAVIRWVSTKLSAGGFFLLYDRLRLTEADAFPLQQTIWRRIEQVHGRGMRTTESFEAYLEDLGTDNRPGALLDYFDWFQSAGLAPALLHLHGNVALLGGAKPA